MARGSLMGGLDSDMDGKLEPAEMRGDIGARIKANLAALDKDRDGVLDQAELAAFAGRLFGGERTERTAAPAASN
jgi:hypothetical protein